MAADRLPEIQARAEAATPGTWGTYYDGSVYHLAADIRLTGAGATCSREIGELPDGDDKTQAFHDSVFIRCARTDVPWLIGEVVRLRAETEQLSRENATQESQLQTAEQVYGAIVHDWELGYLTADEAIRRIRDAQAPAAAIAGTRKAATA